MGLDVPELADREYEEILEEAQKLIPAYSDEWTDFNPHDPGITILEVLAWLTETYVYQLDRVTDEHREKYLRLMGEKPRPPGQATTRVAFTPQGDTAGCRVPAGTKLTVTDTTGETCRFETDHDTALTAAAIRRVVTVGEAGQTDNSHANRTDGMYYRAFGDDPSVRDTLYLGFDADPFGASDRLTLMIDYHDEDIPDPAPSRTGDPSFDPSVELAWEHRRKRDGAWVCLDVRGDGTNAFYEGGHIELSRPDDREQTRGTELPVDDAASEHHWIRCRLVRPGYEIPPQIDAIETNVASASHRASVSGERLEQVGTLDEPTALDGQTFAFEHSPILSARVTVDGERWTEVPDFDASGPDDEQYVLDRDDGSVLFGDGINGKVPPSDATVVADYVYGGGDEGNVPQSAQWRFTDGTTSLDGAGTLDDITVSPTRPATGGTDGESVEAALKRVRRDLRTPHRAVTTNDYRAIASRTPGVRVDRTNVVVADEQITVVAVPYAPPDVPKPEPSEGFLRAVKRYLDERKVLADRVRVIAPRYVGLEVTVTGRTRSQYTDDGHEAAVRAAVEEYVHPLNGFDGNGWPFGRPLFDAELRDQIAGHDVIDRVSDIDISAHGGAVIDDGVVRIDEMSLFYVEEVITDLAEMATPSGGGV